ncbi:Scr1 family TA system antitoxin-like transcriptional regulator [Streptomyces sp. NPDC020298]|uniref:Scr1 family TA system antitoxin-like transcriptional regulator n=1 Tax=unclassified Streptomyces TaxID=2593676 RepID=UPI0033F93E60
MARTQHDPVLFWDRYKPDRDGPSPPPDVAAFFSFVLCEATLRRLIGGRMVMRGQLERLL